MSNANLISKVYFPRLIVPAATVAAALRPTSCISLGADGGADGLVSLPRRTWRIVFLPLHSRFWPCWRRSGPGLWITAVNVRYRDFRYAIPFLVQLGLYVSPVGFSSSVVPAQWRLIYALNPMVGAIDGFRWCLLGSPLDWRAVGVSTLVVTSMLWVGVGQFRQVREDLRGPDLTCRSKRPCPTSPSALRASGRAI